MLIKLDDHVSRIVFARKVVVVEGDTEEVIDQRKLIRRMPKAMRDKLLAPTELVKASWQGRDDRSSEAILARWMLIFCYP
ncbi:hypothetical protein O5541_27295 [Escherichia coli]|nr:hypothetical protein [Escherichia coli]